MMEETAKTPKFSIVKDGSDLDGNGRDGTFDWIEGNAILIIAKDGNANVKNINDKCSGRGC